MGRHVVNHVLNAQRGENEFAFAFRLVVSKEAHILNSDQRLLSDSIFCSSVHLLSVGWGRAVEEAGVESVVNEARAKASRVHFPLCLAACNMSSTSNELVVAVGTTNPSKIQSVQEALARVFPQYTSIKVLPASVRHFPPFLSPYPLLWLLLTVFRFFVVL